MWKIDRGSQVGITTDNFIDALSWSVSELGEKTILLKNMDSINELSYRLDGYVAHGGIINELVPVDTLSPGQVAEFHYIHQWCKLILQVKAAVIGNQANFRIDYEGQGA